MADPRPHAASDHLAIKASSPARGLRFAGSRAVLHSHVTADMLRRQLIQQVGEPLARAIVAQAGRQAGFHDAQLLSQELAFASPRAAVEAQLEVLAASGYGRFELQALELEAKGHDAEHTYMHVRCFGSPEAESQLRLFGRAKLPACWHLVGYSTGWITAVTGEQLLTIESRCVARGDDHCEFETLPYADFVGPEARFWKRVFEDTSTSLTQVLSDQLAEERALVREQEQAIERLTAPLLQVADGILVVPIIGTLDDGRMRSITEKLLQAIAAQATRGVILDVTGMMEESDSRCGQVEGIRHLMSMARSTRLLGAELVMTGISRALARALVDHQIDIVGLRTCQTLQDGIRHLQARR
ncbi:XylR N-terminal domain-containing protein [Pseudenhygromyxa sp. WMMC2535]|uniref:XylR N-terminal domain-containing protein n=1 Tax=Pseudenhygromyxa sp. WMMC2535 TaxID=2712867 RepID=UPI001556C42D|nr:XylR N-terminal domain-containing protein [Pseudenhygromyxa sp. WMMC2535]NVB41047.1 XylR N-terminal domain-containing protein [Pseudenhygromyxa sp. WMMC2535]